MGIEGLDYILNKQEIVPTVSARDLLERSERVEDDYRRHVRTYVPINRAAEGQEGTLSVEDFERRVISEVKNAKAPRGYLTAEYGYGKTSTALYLWQRAEESNLLTVPPFQLLYLPDLVTAIYGWVRYRLSIHSPLLISELDKLYEETSNRSLEKEAEKRGISVVALEDLEREGRLILELQPVDYINYFEQVTDIVLRAGYEGLLVLADEVQQYIEPRVKSSKEPITPLFNLIQMLLTRENHLKFGLILIIGLKEVGLIRELRNDLLHRMRRLSLDLTNVYDFEFASRLWRLLSKEFKFENVASEIVMPEALEALGEIASRTDLSDGPRTVINTFRRMVERFKTYGVSVPPYNPIDLVDDLLAGNIQFAGNNQIQNVTRNALQSDIVRSDPVKYEPAIKAAAAYPASGVPYRTQRTLGVDEALAELMRLAIGEIVLNVGSPENRGVTLFGLHVGVQKTDWLSSTIRDFRRSYGEHHDVTQRRAMQAFSTIVKEIIFKGWTVVEEHPSNYTSNFSIILQGSFQSFAAKYPRRQVHVRILWEDEERKDATVNGDVAVEYRLSLHTELEDDPDQRRSFAQPLITDPENHTACVHINLMYVRPEGVPPAILNQLEGIWSPYDLSPLVLMNIYQMLEEKRADNAIPPQEDQFIARGFQPEMMHNIVRDLFNQEIGAPYGGISQGRITEVAVEKLLDELYADTYQTIIAQSNWRSWLTKYSNAVAQLENLYQKRGEIEVESTKEEIARLLASTNTGLDAFLKTFGSFLKIESEWRGGSAGSVRFMLHPLEAQIVQWLRSSQKSQRVDIGGKTFEVRVLNVSDIYAAAREQGYLNEEIEVLLNLLERRELLEFHQKHLIREIPSQNVDLDNVAIQIREFTEEVYALLGGFPDSQQLLQLQSDAERWQKALENERQSGTPDPQRVHRLSRNIQLRQNELRQFAQDRQSEVQQRISMLRRNLRPINSQHLTHLGNLVEGSVSYVEQVNLLRTHLRNHANRIKAEVERVHASIQSLENTIAEEDLTYEALARCANTTLQLGQDLDIVNTKVGEFETMYRHLLDWQRLVNDGSQLLNEMQQMGHLTSSHQAEFEGLAQRIKEDVSTKGNKLDALPNHSVFAAPLGKLTQDVRAIRREAEDLFVRLQNRYSQLLTGKGPFTREQMGRPFEYNISNPDESYRLLHERVQNLLRNLHAQLTRVIRDRQQDVRNILGTPFFGYLPEDDRNRIEQEGDELIRLADDELSRLSSLETRVEDITVIRDLPEDGTGQFQALLNDLLRIFESSRELKEGSNRLSQWLTDIRLTPEEEELLSQLRSENVDTAVPLLDWLNSSGFSTEEFWGSLRTLYEKHRIRVLVTRVRR